PTKLRYYPKHRPGAPFEKAPTVGGFLTQPASHSFRSAFASSIRAPTNTTRIILRTLDRITTTLPKPGRPPMFDDSTSGASPRLARGATTNSRAPWVHPNCG